MYPVPQSEKGLKPKFWVYVYSLVGLCLLWESLTVSYRREALWETGGDWDEVKPGASEMENLKDKMTLGCQAQRQKKREMDPKDTFCLFFQLG